jgi:serine/threonine protein kinase
MNTNVPNRPPVRGPARKPGVPVEVTEHRKSRAPKGPLLAPGTRLDRYIIDKQLGRGGMGIVYAAFDTHLGRRVAIKLVRGHNSQQRRMDRKRDRLMREAQALARLAHPNIVSLYDSGTANGMLYLAMELVEGQSLSNWLRERPRTWEEIVEALSQAAQGIAAAHAAGIIHRDVKPSNVHVGFDGRVRVLDFGLARAMPEYDSSNDVAEAGVSRKRESFQDLLNTRLTDVNLVLGTTGYMSPEQIVARPTGPLSDQFSFCVTLYEALYGIKPYPGKTAIEVATRFREGRIEPPPPGIRVPRRLHRALLRGLSIERADRFRSMKALIKELEAVPRPGWSRFSNAAVLLGTAWVAACSAVWLYHELDQPNAEAAECSIPAQADDPIAR